MVLDVAWCWLILDKKVTAVVIVIATQHVLHIEYFEGDARSSNYDGQQMINFRLFKFCTVTFLSLFLGGFLTGYESEFGWDGKVSQGHEEYLL